MSQSFLPHIASPRIQPSVKIQINGKPALALKTGHRNSDILPNRIPINLVLTPKTSTPTTVSTRSQFSLSRVSSTKSAGTSKSQGQLTFSDSFGYRESTFRSATCLPTIPNKSSFKKLSCPPTGPQTPVSIDSLCQETSLLVPNLGLSAEKSKEECDFRNQRISKEVNELRSMELFDEEAKNVYTSAHMVKSLDRTFKLATHVLSTFGIEVRPYTTYSSDSGMTMTPITGKLQLANFYKMFVPEISRFNYVFLSNLHIGVISVCDELELTNKQYAAILDKKLHNGLFVLEKLKDRKSIQQHWFKVVLYHFLRVMPEFYRQWRDFLWEELGVQSKASPFEELQITFNQLMGTSTDVFWEEDAQARARVKYLRDALKDYHFEPEELVEHEETVDSDF